MASEDPRLQEMMRRAVMAVRSDLALAYTLGAEAGIRWSAERIAVVGACEAEKDGNEAGKCPECKGWKRWAREPDGSVSEVHCATCNGTGKAKE